MPAGLYRERGMSREGRAEAQAGERSGAEAARREFMPTLPGAQFQRLLFLAGLPPAAPAWLKALALSFLDLAFSALLILDLAWRRQWWGGAEAASAGGQQLRGQQQL